MHMRHHVGISSLVWWAVRSRRCSVLHVTAFTTLKVKMTAVTCAQATNLYSPDNAVYLVAQNDGNLVL